MICDFFKIFFFNLCACACVYVCTSYMCMFLKDQNMVLDLLNQVTSSCELLDVGTGNLTFVLC